LLCVLVGVFEGGAFHFEWSFGFAEVGRNTHQFYWTVYIRYYLYDNMYIYNAAKQYGLLLNVITTKQLAIPSYFHFRDAT